ncbi:MAG: prealbumin-like fold domain-containing protein, partial [Nitrososphaerales archaeon]
MSTLTSIIVALALVATSNGLPEVFGVHTYSTSISPSVAQVGVGSTFTVTITNAGQDDFPRRLGAFTIAIPSSFTNLGVPSISPPPGRSWTCSLSGSTISCHAIQPQDRLFDGESLTVSILAIPQQASVVPFQWTVTAYHFRNFTDPITLNGPQPSVTVTGLGFIKIIKDTDPEPDPTDFSFTSTTLSPSNFQLDDDGAGNNPLSNSKTFNNLPAGIYDVAETPAPGYITNAECSDGSPVSAINLGAGEFISCKFTNSQPGTITIVKDAVPDDPTDFSFATLGSGLSNFSLDDDGDNANELSNEKTFSSLGSGSYTITEIVPLDWGVADIDCETAGGTTFTVAGDSVIINLVGSGSAECTFTDVRLGSITVVKDTVPNDATAFSFTSSTLSPNNFQLDDDGDNGNALSNTQPFNNLLPGTYDLAETADPSYQTLAECSDGSPINAIALESGENITCTFTNSKVGTITIIKDADPN